MSDPRPSRRALIPALSSVALAALAGACSSSGPVANYDLTAPRQIRGGSAVGQIAVAEPSAVQPLDTDRIIVKEANGAVSSLGGGQWADRLPRLIQSRLIQTFENTSRIKVSRPGDRVTADYQLNSELRAFQVDGATGEAFVQMSAKLINDRNGRIAISRIFTARVPVGTIDAANAAQALDRALSSVLLDITRWIGTAPRLDSPPAPDLTASSPAT